jgi:hypothetical protein
MRLWIDCPAEIGRASINSMALLAHQATSDGAGESRPAARVRPWYLDPVPAVAQTTQRQFAKVAAARANVACRRDRRGVYFSCNSRPLCVRTAYRPQPALRNATIRLRILGRFLCWQ